MDDDQETFEINGSNTRPFNSYNQAQYQPQVDGKVANNEIYYRDRPISDVDEETDQQDEENPNYNQTRETNNNDTTTNRTYEEKEEFYFQTKIRNSGFWGKVRLRRGTWIFMVSLILLAASIILIAVFWNWWFGPAINWPFRCLAITVLVLGVMFFIIGLTSNFAMVKDPYYKFFVGSVNQRDGHVHFRIQTWILIASIVAIVIASDCITVYYTYWHNRYVNTPLIVIAIVFYFFGGLAFIYSLHANVMLMQQEMRRAKGLPMIEKEAKMPKQDKYEKMREEEFNALLAMAQAGLIPAEATNTTADQSKIVNETLNTTAASQQLLNESQTPGTTGDKKDFRKKGLKLQPRALYLHNTSFDQSN